MKKPPARKGYQAADLKAAMTDQSEGMRQAPRVVVPAEVIECMRVTGRDKITATDQAVYFGLMSLAIEAGIDAPTHTVALRDLARFVEVDHIDRIKSSMRRLSETVITYQTDTEDIEETGWLHLVTDTRLRRRKTGEQSASTISFAVPEYTRSLFLNPERYAKLEILAFPRFNSRYTARLYPRIALRAGYKSKYASDVLTWTVDPEELATELGYVTENRPFEFGQFKRNLLDPVMRDIAENVMRFEASYDVVRPESTGSGRGRPIQKLVFKFSPSRSLVAEAKMRYLSKEERERVLEPEADVTAYDLPSAEAIARGCTHLGRGPDEVSAAWRAALLKSKQTPLARVAGRVTGGGLLYTMTAHGVDQAFRVWADAQRPGVALDTTRPPSTVRVSTVSAAAPVTVAPVEATETDTVRTPRDLETKIRDARASAAGLVDHCDNVFTRADGTKLPMPFDDEAISEFLYDDCSPWVSLASEEMPVAFKSAYTDIRSALPMMHKLAPTSRRATTRALAKAIMAWDSEDIVRVARSVSHRPQPTSVPVPPKVPSIFKRGGFVDAQKSESLSEGY